METVQLQCGSCHKLMAISVAHLGGQVQCPHCRAVVQAPPRPEPPRPASAPPPHVVERESIFAGPEASEDIFGAGSGPARPLVELPPEPAPTAAPTVEFTRLPDVDHVAPAPQPAAAPEPAEPDDDDALPPPRPRVAIDRGTGALFALIFLVPYALLTTAFIVYLLMQLWSQPHPLDMLPDPRPDKGGPRKAERVRHDLPLAAHQKVGLGKSLRVGELEVQPQKVEKSGGNLVLKLRVKNVSDDQTFAPISDAFLHAQADRTGGKPYTFLQSENFNPVYGGYLQMKWGAPGSERDHESGDLGPGQEEQIILTTMENDQKLVKKIAASSDRLVWRVQLRRGLVAHHGKAVSATTVVGVAFNARDVK